MGLEVTPYVPTLTKKLVTGANSFSLELLYNIVLEKRILMS